MAFVAGPRQVGKTTSCTAFRQEHAYFNWDDEDHQRLILAGPAAVAAETGLSASATIVFDELHKYRHWRNFIKGFFDTYGRDRLQIVVTGSARLDVYRKGADSLMGRYFMYRMHPLSVAEIVRPQPTEQLVLPPGPIEAEEFNALVCFGGFPEPFLKRNVRFHNRWKRTRRQLLFREELRDIARIYEIGQVELLATFLQQQAGGSLNMAALATRIGASQDSIRRWVAALESLYYCFLIRPWRRNIVRSLIKEPRVYLWDWSIVGEVGARNENIVAAHLLKAVHWWQDTGWGEFGLYFVRTKDGREVDFLVTRDDEPWFLVEVKTSAHQPLSKNLGYFQRQTGAPHAFQVVMDADFAATDCFAVDFPIKVPARTFLSQLV